MNLVFQLLDKYADLFDYKYLTVGRLHRNFHLDQVPEFPVPVKENNDEKA